MYPHMFKSLAAQTAWRGRDRHPDSFVRSEFDCVQFVLDWTYHNPPPHTHLESKQSCWGAVFLGSLPPLTFLGMWHFCLEKSFRLRHTNVFLSDKPHTDQSNVTCWFLKWELTAAAEPMLRDAASSPNWQQLEVPEAQTRVNSTSKISCLALKEEI